MNLTDYKMLPAHISNVRAGDYLIDNLGNVRGEIARTRVEDGRMWVWFVDGHADGGFVLPYIDNALGTGRDSVNILRPRG